MKEFSALRKRIRVKWHPDGSARMAIRNQHGDFSEIGRIETTDSSIVDWQKQKLATRGQIKHARIDPKFRGMGLATKMYGEAMKQAPRGRLVSDNAQFDGGYAIWNRLQRNKGYKIRENPKADGAEDGFVSRDKRPLFIGRINPAARKQSNLSAKLRLREFSALRKRIRVNWHSDGSARMTVPNAYGGVNEIGRIETKNGQIKWTEIDPPFSGMGLATKMYGEAMKSAPRGRLVSDTEQLSGGAAIWNRLQRNNGYKIRENPKADLTDFDGIASRDRRPLFIGRINPEARKRWARETLPLNDQKKFRFSAKLRLRELARGDYAIPALGKMLKDRSFLEEFLTGKRGPKLGDLKVGAFRMAQRALRNKSGRTILSGRPESPVDVSVSKVMKSRAGKEIPGDVERIKEAWVSNSYNPAIMFVTNQTTLTQARQRARDQVAKMIRKGRAGGDVYEEVNRP